MPIPKTIRGAIIGLVAGLGLTVLAACNGSVGPDQDGLIGTWVQDGAAQTDAALVVENAVVTYAPDGLSDFEADMTLTQPGTAPQTFGIAADVTWTLEETVLTRTLRDVRVSPKTATPESEAVARALEEAYRASPPGRLIVEDLDETHLTLLDADTGATLRYTRR
ncbi:hypothetical protein [uncultured Algimonas sp.]|uniref:hypothetical protein n=1 Tax=uncultured Algimonas sp. TaxID=1547920 RepID=UPI00263204CE|nr:hypothetical protein [uncultured Algimonas sp.]